MYVRMLIAVPSHAMDHESSANRRKNLEIYEKATRERRIRALACGRVCVRVRSCPHRRDHSSGLRRASERVVGAEGEKGPKIGSKFIRVPGRAATSLRSPFIRTAAFFDSLPAIPLVYSLSSFAASRISRLLSLLFLSPSRLSLRFRASSSPRLSLLEKRKFYQLIGIKNTFEGVRKIKV